MTITNDVGVMIGAVAFDRDNDRIGEIRQVYLDAETDEPTWVGVRVGLFGADVLVPLEGAEWDERALHIDVPRTVVRSAPPVDVEEPLDASGEERLLRHYGIPCVRRPREPDVLLEVADEEVSYSVKDDAMGDDVVDGAGERDEGDLGSAMRQASEQRVEGVTGRMLETAPEPLGEAPQL